MFSNFTNTELRCENPENKAERQPGKLEIEYGKEGMATHCNLKDKEILGDGRIEIVDLKLPQWNDSNESQMKRAVEQSESKENIKIDDREEENLQEVSNNMKGNGFETEELRAMFYRIFRRFGDHVAMAKKDKGSGFDTWNRGGHRMNFSDASAIFVIAESRAEELNCLLKNQGAENFAGVEPKFRIRPKFDFLHEPENKENKMGMVFYYDTPDGKSEKIVFMFGDEQKKKEKSDENSEDEK